MSEVKLDLGVYPQVRILVTRDVNLDSESDCAKRNLLKSASDANTILGEYMDLYDLIMSQSAIVDEKAYKFADVCHKPDITGSECEVGNKFLFLSRYSQPF